MALEIVEFSAEQAELSGPDPMQVYGQLVSGQLCPLEAGLVDVPVRWSDGIAAQFYTQDRVSRMSPTGAVEQRAIVKLKTMYDLTDDGRNLVNDLNRLVSEGSVYLSTKELGAWRVSRPLLRKLSGDEVPQLLCNVIEIGKSWFPDADLMKMDLVGSARPPMAQEIVLKGDNSSDPYNRALETVAESMGYDNRFHLHARLAQLYRPALFSTATAQGKRQLNKDGYISWINGILDYHEIEQMPKAIRRRATRSIISGTIKNVLQRVDAA